MGAGRGQQDALLADVPLSLVDGFVFIQARVNGSEELNLLFDTGCTQLVIHSSTAERLGLTATPITKHDGSGPFVERVIEGVSVTIGDLTLERLDALQRDPVALQRRFGARVDGVIGADLLRNHVIEIDYDQMRFTMYDSDRFLYAGAGTDYDIAANPYVAIMVASIVLGDGEVLSGRFLIDTGAGVSVALNTPFVNRHDLLKRIGVEHISYTLAVQSVRMTSHPGRLARFDLGHHAFDNMPVLLSQTEAGPLSPDVIAGIIGNQVWKRFNTIFDYKRNTLHLEPNGLHGEEFRVDGSGLAISPTASGGFVVHGVFEGSPAAAARVRVGDVITEINGVDASELATHEMKELLARDGETVSLAIDRDGDPLTVSLRLKRQY
jgi:predicted aspartyl protease